MGRLISPVQKIAQRMQREITRVDLAFADPVEISKAAEAVLIIIDLTHQLVKEMQIEVDEYHDAHKHD